MNSTNGMDFIGIRFTRLAGGPPRRRRRPVRRRAHPKTASVKPACVEAEDAAGPRTLIMDAAESWDRKRFQHGRDLAGRVIPGAPAGKKKGDA